MNLQTVQHNNLMFIVVNNLGDLETKYLRQHFDFSQLHIDDFVNKQQVPKIEIGDKYKLIVLDFPSVKNHKDKDKDKDKPKLEEKKTEDHQHQDDEKNHEKTEAMLAPIKSVVTTPVKLAIPDTSSKLSRIVIGHVNFFMGEDYLVVLHDDKTPIIDELLTESQKTLHNREELMSHGPEYLFYRIVDVLVDTMYAPMQEIAQMIDKIDTQIVDDEHVTTIVEDISTTRRNLVVYQAILKPAISIFQELSQGKYPEMSEGMRYYYRSILDHIQKVKYRMDSSRELLEGIARSHESLLTARTNEIVKILTIFTAILLPLTLVASIYGMNINGLPFAENPEAFVYIVVSMGVLAVFMMILFKLRRWL